MIRVVQRTPNIGVTIKMKKVKEAAQAVKVPKPVPKYRYPRMVTGWLSTAVIGTDGRLWVNGEIETEEGNIQTAGWEELPGQEGQKWRMVTMDNYGYMFCALREDGTLWFWGRKTVRGVSQWVRTDLVWPPVQLTGPDVPIVWVAQATFVSEGFIAGIGEDGSLWEWRGATYDDWVLLPDNNIMNRVGEDTDWMHVQGGGWSKMGAKKLDGSVWAWGLEYYGSATGTSDTGQWTKVTEYPVKIGEAV
jgi:hypothetical protein